jgi:Domain of unknown function (DUF4276)
MNIGLLVEGHGERFAAPILVRRIAESLGLACVIRSVLRQPRSALLKKGELERAVTLLGNKVGSGGAILTLIDADDDPACLLGPDLLSRAQAARPDCRVGVVLAVREYEAWFLAAAESLRSRRGLPGDLEVLSSPEDIRDAKGWLDVRMPRGYSPTTDQPALTGLFDIEQARRARSFMKLVRDLTRLLATQPDQP